MAPSEHAWRLVRVRKITGKIHVITGLRIGASQETMEIGGLDNPILRNAADDMPYIPGSSLKGRMRALAEWWLGEVPPDGNPTKGDPKWKSGRVFGVSASKETRIGPTRIIVRDAFLTSEWKESFRKGKPVTEVKHENSINRLTAMANPRPMERVVPGVEFGVEIVYRVLDMGDGGSEDERNFEDVVKVALALVQADCLGAAGSRGCGQVEFRELRDEAGQPIELPKLTKLPRAKSA